MNLEQSSRSPNQARLFLTPQRELRSVYDHVICICAVVDIGRA
jgi:hypothetical protein